MINSIINAIYTMAEIKCPQYVYSQRAFWEESKAGNDTNS